MSEAANILVVDDEPNIRLTLSALLRRAGHTVTAAASGEEAVSLFGSQSFDLMLVDATGGHQARDEDDGHSGHEDLLWL